MSFPTDHYEKHNKFKKPALRKLKFLKKDIRDLTKEYYAAHELSKTGPYNKLLQTVKLFNSYKRTIARIHDGTFGICPLTNKLIHRERLILMFHIWPKYPDVIHSHKI
jgi:RNA polymerase-binding transcription factor DksA